MAEISNGYVEGSSGRDPRCNWGEMSMGDGRREGRIGVAQKDGSQEKQENISQCWAKYFLTQMANRDGEDGNREYKVREARTSDTWFRPCHHHRSASAQAAESSSQLLLSLARLAIWLGHSWL